MAEDTLVGEKVGLKYLARDAWGQWRKRVEVSYAQSPLASF